jgi:phosphate:Na+ symporter
VGLPFTLIDLAGSVALLLWGVRMVQTGMQRAFGAKLRRFLGSALRNRLSALAAGIGVTAVLQSSTATGLMITGFAAGGLVDLVPALAVMLGANIGTTLIVQVFSFNVADVAPGLILVGVLMFRRAQAGPRDFGRVLIGLGLMLMALSDLLTLVTPFENEPSLRMMLGAMSTQPLLDVILAAGVTWAAHSSVAVVLLVMSLAARGVVPPDSAYALVLGANLGTAINPVLEGASGADPAARRVPIGNLLTRVGGVLAGLVLLAPLGRLMVTAEPDDARSVADFHTLFNLVVAGVMLPLLPPYARLLCRLLPKTEDARDPGRPMYLDPAARETPVAALGGALREALRLTDMLETMLAGVRETVERPDRRKVAETRHTEDSLDALNTAIKMFLTTLDTEAMTEDDHRRATDILIFATNIEQCGDVLDRNVLGAVSRMVKRGLLFSREGQADLLRMIDRLSANTRTAASLLVSEDLRGARMLAAEKATFREMEAEATRQHFARLRAGRQDSTQTSSLHLDVLSDLRRVNAHLVAAGANRILERSGDLPAASTADDDARDAEAEAERFEEPEPRS